MNTFGARCGLDRAVFLDRDGVINRRFPDVEYVRDPSQFELLPGVGEALRTLQDLGYRLVVVTNQRGIGRGFMTEEDLGRVHAYMERLLKEYGVSLSAIYFCPHDVDARCSCRKPEPGMILAAVRDLKIDLASSYMIGDSESDTLAGRRAGARTVRVGADGDPAANEHYPSLPAFVEALAGKDRIGSRS